MEDGKRLIVKLIKFTDQWVREKERRREEREE